MVITTLEKNEQKRWRADDWGKGGFNDSWILRHGERMQKMDGCTRAIEVKYFCYKRERGESEVIK